MSLFNEEQLDCPKCRKQVPFILHSSINVGIDPQDKEKVLDLSIFQYHCPHCGASDLVCYPVLYHDPEQGVWIQVFWREEDFGQPVEKELRDFIEIMGQTHYRRREVFGYWELVEKIRIFDAGLDDFAIALMKTMRKIQQPEIQLFFDKKENNQFTFRQCRNGEMLPESVSFDEKGYEMALEMAGQWEKPHEFYEDLRVDESYFYNDLMNVLMDMKSKEKNE